MGCVHSQPDTQPSPQSSKSPPQQQRQQTGASQAPPSEHTTTSPSLVFDTQSTASLSESGTGAAYFGILKDDASNTEINKVAVESDLKSRVVVGRNKKDDSSGAAADKRGMRQAVKVEGLAMTMRWIVLVEGRNEDKVEDERIVRELVEEAMKICDEKWNVYNCESELSMLNKAKAGKKFPVSKELSDLFGRVNQMVELTQGMFDPSVGSVKAKVSHLLAREKRPPGKSDLEHLKHAVGWQKCISYNPKTQTITKRNGHTMIDFNGIAKGYTVDFICKRLNASGYSSFYVDWAGDIATAGRHPSGRPWRTAIMNPPTISHLFECWSKDQLQNAIDPEDVAYLLDIERENGEYGQLAVCTSGDYFNVMKYGFHHIVQADGLCMMKTSNASIASVTVLASQCAVADALATAAMTCNSVSMAKRFLKKLAIEVPEMAISLCIISRDGTREVSSSFKPQHGTNDNKVVDKETDTSSIGCSIERAVQYAPRARGFLRPPSLDAYEMDSVRTLSMDPVPIISFMIMNEAQQCKSLRSQTQRRCSFSYTYGISYELVVREIIDIPMAALMIAEVTRILCDREASARSAALRVVHGDDTKSLTVDFSTLKKPLPAMEVPDAVKAVERKVPAAVWLVVTSSADGEIHGLTATSTVVSKDCPGLLVFNVGQNTVFRAVLGGIGSKVTAYVLKSGLEDIADNYRTRSRMSEEAIKRLDRSASAVQVQVKTIAEVSDHVLITAKIEEVVEPEYLGHTLMWCEGRYMTL